MSAAPNRKLKPNVPGAAEDRRHLILFSLDEIRQAFVKTRFEAMTSDVAVLVLDVNDEVAHAIAVDQMGQEAVSLHRMAIGNRLVPTVIMGFPRSDAKIVIGDTSPGAATFLGRHRPGHFIVVGVAQGGNAFAYLPIDECAS